MLTAALVALALGQQAPSQAGEPVPGDIFLNRSDVGELVVGTRPPEFNEEGHLIFKGWTQEATGFWGDMPELTFEQLKAGTGCCISVFTKGRSLILALSIPQSRRSNGEIASELITNTQRFDLSPHEGWTARCVDRGRYYVLAIVDRRTRNARLVSIRGGARFETRNVQLAVPVRFDGEECSDLHALN